MRYDPLPDEHHIARLCQTTQISEDGNIMAPAFMLKPHEQTLSVNWLEFFNCLDRESAIDKF